LGLTYLLRSQTDLKVAGEAKNCQEACDALNTLRPDAVVLELQLPDASGSEAVSRLCERDTSILIIVYTTNTDERVIIDVIQHGVVAYVLKSSPTDCLDEAIRVALRGGLYLDPYVAAIVTDRVTGISIAHDPEQPKTLSSMEYTVLRHIASGQRNRDIANDLSVSERTVKYHITSLLAKLGAKNRTDAVRIATVNRLISL
jgi:DNA-binding NarL/FixJ family response regulator